MGFGATIIETYKKQSHVRRHVLWFYFTVRSTEALGYTHTHKSVDKFCIGVRLYGKNFVYL